MFNINDLYEIGKIPERYYNQLNGKNAQENYIRIKKTKKKNKEGFIFSIIKETMRSVLDSALNEILDEFEKRQ